MSANTLFVCDRNLLWEAQVMLNLYWLDLDPWLSSVIIVLDELFQCGNDSPLEQMRFILTRSENTLPEECVRSQWPTKRISF